MKSRREFLSAGAAMGVLAATHSGAATTASSKSCVADCSITELNQRIARRDFSGITKDMLPTPCLVVDLDLYNANVKQMADTAKANGIHVRPHVKVHKSVEVARHQMSALCCPRRQDCGRVADHGTDGRSTTLSVA